MVDQHVAAVANVIDNWSINAARDVAWETAVGLWDVRDFDIATQLLTGALPAPWPWPAGAFSSSSED